MIYELQITTATESKFLLSEFPKKFSWLGQHGYSLSIDKPTYEQINTLFLDIKLQGNTTDTHYKDEDIIYIFKHQIAEFLAEHIVKDWEKKLTWKEIIKKGRHIPTADQVPIFNKALDFMKRCNSNESMNLLMNYGRKNKMAHRILDYIYYHNKLVLEGFINFCMKDYLTEIKFAVDLACEELRNEKEYNEFVKLLRHFVDSQPPIVMEVNVLMDPHGRFSLWDGNGVRIEEKNMECYIEDLTRGEINLDDVLVSILITVAPLRIVLHNTPGNQRSESVKMIKNVFSERISECKGCERCFTYGRNGERVTKLEQ
jgi:putative sporulation protein YtxC